MIDKVLKKQKQEDKKLFEENKAKEKQFVSVMWDMLKILSDGRPEMLTMEMNPEDVKGNKDNLYEPVLSTMLSLMRHNNLTVGHCFYIISMLQQEMAYMTDRLKIALNHNLNDALNVSMGHAPSQFLDHFTMEEIHDKLLSYNQEKPKQE